MSEQLEDTKDKAERAYAVYATEGRADIEKTASICGIPSRTLYRYRSQYDWEGRLKLAQDQDVELDVELAAKIIKHGMPDVARKMLWLCVGEKPLVDPNSGELKLHPDTGRPIMMPAAENKDALQAGRWLLQYGMMSAGDILRGSDMPMPFSIGPSASGEPGVKMPAREQARDILNANYSNANTRRGGRKRV